MTASNKRVAVLPGPALDGSGRVLTPPHLFQHRHRLVPEGRLVGTTGSGLPYLFMLRTILSCFGGGLGACERPVDLTCEPHVHNTSSEAVGGKEEAADRVPADRVPPSIDPSVNPSRRASSCYRSSFDVLRSGKTEREAVLHPEDFAVLSSKRLFEVGQCASGS